MYFSIKKKVLNGQTKLLNLLNLYYTTTGNTINLDVNRVRRQLTLPSSFNGKNCYMVGGRF